MELDPTYLIWNPSLNQKDGSSSSITFNITPFAVLNFPKGPKEFYVQLLGDLGIGIEPSSWDIIVYRSNYHREEEETKNWQDHWKKNWQVSITLNSPIFELPALLEEYVETYAYSGDPQWYESNDQQEIGCMIIADFKDKTSAEKAKSAINTSDKIQKLAKDISAPSPKIYSVGIGNVCYQIQIFLGLFPESFFENGAAYALAIENICNQRGGITSFDKRANEWGEI